jgi:hypothetical protein
MRNLIIRKNIEKFSNWQFDDFMQRTVKASDSLNNSVFSKYVSELQKSVSGFQQERKNSPASGFTVEIHSLSTEADNVFRKIKAAADYFALWTTGPEQETAQKAKSMLSDYAGVTSAGLAKKFVDYEALITELKNDTETVSVLKIDSVVKELFSLTEQYREALKKRDKYRSNLKGRRKEARIKAEECYLTLRRKVEAFAEFNGEKEVSEFIGLVNEALIYVSPNVANKKDTETLKN